MALEKFLREKHEATVTLFQAHRDSVLELQEVLYNVTLQATAEELALNVSSLHRAKEWIEDVGSIFRMLKKHNFRIVEAQTALQHTLHWRMSFLVPLQDAGTQGRAPFITCLPPNVQDTFGRPVLLIKLSGLPDNSEETKLEIFRAYDAMRLRLRLTQSCQVFQCLIMVDFADANISKMAVELIPWFIREVAPRFPGMCAAVLMVNYSWTYSGLYNLVKRLLPSSVLERIIFPTQAELLLHFERSQLPKEYGGDLDLSPPPGDLLTRPVPAAREDLHLHSASRNSNLAAYLPSMSLLNPFYGYPAVANPGSSTAQLKNGRRRKRDLARTLCQLWLTKLKRTTDKTWLWVIMTVILWLAELRK